MWRKRLLSDEDEFELPNRPLGNAFKLALINDVQTEGDKLAFHIVGQKMLKHLSEQQLLDIQSFSGIDMRTPVRLTNCVCKGGPI